MSDDPDGRTLQILATLDLIYAAAVDPLRWPEAISAIAHAVQGAVAVEWRDPRTGTAVVHEHGGDLKFLRSMLDERAEVDAARADANPAPVLQIANPDGHGFGVPGWRGLSMVRPAGWRDTLVAPLSRDPSHGARLCVARSLIQPGLSLDDRRRLEILAPHMARAITLARGFRNALLEIGRLEAVLDILPAPILLAGSDGQLAFMNRAARAVVDDGDLITVVAGRIGPSGQASAEHWRSALAIGPDPLDRSRCRSLPIRGRSGGAGIAHILDLSSAAGGRENRRAPRAVLLVRAKEGTAQPRGLFEAMHGLSPAEARVLAAFAQAGGVPGERQRDLDLAEVARRLAISRNTAKTHLQRLFEKTGTQRQSELLHRYFAWRHVMPEMPDGTS